MDRPLILETRFLIDLEREHNRGTPTGAGSEALDSALRCWPASILLRARGNATVLRAVTSAGGVAAVSAAVLDAEEAKLGRAHSYRRQIRRCARG